MQTYFDIVKLVNHLDWTTLANKATVLEAIVVAIAAIYAIAQFRESKKSRNLAATLQMLELLGSEDFKRALRSLGKLSSDPSELSENDWNIVTKVSHRINRVGLLMVHKMLHREVILDMYAGTISYAWGILKPYIRYRRAKTSPGWQNQFEALAAIADRHQKKAIRRMKRRSIPVAQEFVYQELQNSSKGELGGTEDQIKASESNAD